MYYSPRTDTPQNSGSCRCALIGWPCRLRMLSIFSTLTTCRN